MADYNEMKEKLRREGAAEQTAKFMSTAGTPARTSMRYGSMTDAEEKASAAKPTPMFESAPPSEAKAPTAMVRGVPEEMTAEYIPAAAKQPAAPPPAAAPSLAAQLAERVKKADADLAYVDAGLDFGEAAGAGVGAALGAGIGGPIGAGVGLSAGRLAGLTLAYPSVSKLRDAAVADRDAALHDVRAALRSGKITEEEWKAALGQKK